MPQRSGQPRFQPPLKRAAHRRERVRRKAFLTLQRFPELKMPLAANGGFILNLERLPVIDVTEIRRVHRRLLRGAAFKSVIGGNFCRTQAHPALGVDVHQRGVTERGVRFRAGVFDQRGAR